MKRIYCGKWPLVCFPATAGFGIFSTAALADYRYNYGYGPGMMGWWGPMGWFGPLGMILFWVLLVIVIILLFKRNWSSKPGGLPSESALDILKKRYARGEINKEEFLEKKKDLE